jgi:hypothetical protein
MWVRWDRSTFRGQRWPRAGCFDPGLGLVLALIRVWSLYAIGVRGGEAATKNEPDEFPWLGVSVVVCTPGWKWVEVVGLGPNAAWLSTGGSKVERKDSRGEL